MLALVSGGVLGGGRRPPQLRPGAATGQPPVARFASMAS